MPSPKSPDRNGNRTCTTWLTRHQNEWLDGKAATEGSRSAVLARLVRQEMIRDKENTE